MGEWRRRPYASHTPIPTMTESHRMAARPGPSRSLRLPPPHFAAELLPDVAAQLHEAGHAAHDLRVPGPGDVHGDDLPHAPGPVGHDDDPVPEDERLVDAV